MPVPALPDSATRGGWSRRRRRGREATDPGTPRSVRSPSVAHVYVEVDGLDAAVCSLAIHPEGVDWGAVDGAPVHLVFLVLRPAVGGDQHDPERHLDMMRWISRLGRESDFRRFAMGAKTKTELVDLLKEMASI